MGFARNLKVIPVNTHSSMRILVAAICDFVSYSFGPALQALALGPPACVNTRTALKGGRGRGHRATGGQLRAPVFNHKSFLYNWPGGGCYLVWSRKPKGLFVNIQSSHFAIRKSRPRKRKWFPGSHTNGVQAGPGEHKDLFARHTGYVFCCVFILFGF